MTTQAKATFSVASWKEENYNEQKNGAKFTRSHVSYTYDGDLQAESTLEYLMFYAGEGQETAFVGLEHIVGSLNGHSGSFVLQHTGKDVPDTGVEASYFVVPGSGTGELAGLSGSGSVRLPEHQDRYPFTLDYDLP